MSSGELNNRHDIQFEINTRKHPYSEMKRREHLRQTEEDGLKRIFFCLRWNVHLYFVITVSTGDCIVLSCLKKELSLKGKLSTIQTSPMNNGYRQPKLVSWMEKPPIVKLVKDSNVIQQWNLRKHQRDRQYSTMDYVHWLFVSMGAWTKPVLGLYPDCLWFGNKRTFLNFVCFVWILVQRSHV